VPKLEPLEEDLTVLFTVDVSEARNRWSPDIVIDPATISHVGLKGQNEVIGGRAGTWELSDTVSTDSTDASLLMLNDEGLDGDETAGDNVWSLNVTFPTGITGGPCLYKYSIYYPGSDTLYSHDNEMHTQDDNHYIYISPDYPTVMNDIFGVPSVNGEPVGVDKEETLAIPEQIALDQNYPNPFNPTTNIAFKLPKADLANITIYNVLGQRIETLVNRQMTAGYHTVQFDGATLSSGVYFIRLQAGGQTKIRKMMLLK
jgi:hypothetical protein